MNPDFDEFSDFDPEVAAEFDVLNRIDPPDTWRRVGAAVAPVDRAPTKPVQDWRAWGLPAAAAAVLVAVGLAIWFASRPSELVSTTPPSTVVMSDGLTTTTVRPTTVPPTTVPQAVDLTTRQQAAAGTDGWVAVDLPSTAAARSDVVAWTGSEILLWGGEVRDGLYAGEPGLAFDPEASTWRQLAAGPKQPGFGAAGVWTGTELFVCCGQGTATVALYDPTSDSWREGAASPVSSQYVEAIWTGERVLVVTDASVASYDPQTDSWDEATASPAPLGRLRETVWAGDQLIVWPADTVRAVASGLSYDPTGNEWTILPDPPAWPAVPSIGWTGTRVVVWGGLPGASIDQGDRGVGSMWNPADQTWTEITDVLPDPYSWEGLLGSQSSLIVDGESVLLSTGSFASGLYPEPDVLVRETSLLLRLDAEANEWRLLGNSPVPNWWSAHGLLARDRYVFVTDHVYLSPPDWNPTGSAVPDVRNHQRTAAQDAESAARDGVDPAVAELSWADRVDERERFEVEGATWVLSSFPSETQNDFIARGVAGPDFDPSSSEVLIVVGEQIVQAFPALGVPLNFMNTDGSYVYAGRFGDGGYPYDALMRIDPASGKIDRVLLPPATTAESGLGPEWVEGTLTQRRHFDNADYGEVFR